MLGRKNSILLLILICGHALAKDLGNVPIEGSTTNINLEEAQLGATTPGTAENLNTKNVELNNNKPTETDLPLTTENSQPTINNNIVTGNPPTILPNQANPSLSSETNPSMTTQNEVKESPNAIFNIPEVNTPQASNNPQPTNQNQVQTLNQPTIPEPISTPFWTPAPAPIQAIKYESGRFKGGNVQLVINPQTTTRYPPYYYSTTRQPYPTDPPTRPPYTHPYTPPYSPPYGPPYGSPYGPPYGGNTGGYPGGSPYYGFGYPGYPLIFILPANTTLTPANTQRHASVAENIFAEEGAAKVANKPINTVPFFNFLNFGFGKK